MPFDSGSQSFVICQLPKTLPDDALERFQAHRAGKLDNIADEPQVGWVSGRHLLDTQIEEDTATCAGYLHLYLRQAVRKIPATLFKAECRIEELARLQANQSFVLPRKQRREIREGVKERLLKQMPPTLSGVPCVIDANHKILYLGAASPSQINAFLGFFEDTIGFEPAPMYPELLAERVCRVKPEDLPVLAFTELSRRERPPATLGRDFVTWLWFFQNEKGGTIDLDNGTRFAIAIDGPLQFAAEGPGAMESVVRKGAPTASAEAKAALGVGKKLVRAKFTLAREKDTWDFTLDADTLAARGMKLPAGEKLDPVSHFQERVIFLDNFREALWKLFGTFIEQLSDGKQAKALQREVAAWAAGLRCE
jgi:hypothetical protein